MYLYNKCNAFCTDKLNATYTLFDLVGPTGQFG